MSIPIKYAIIKSCGYCGGSGLEPDWGRGKSCTAAEYMPCTQCHGTGNSGYVQYIDGVLDSGPPAVDPWTTWTSDQGIN